MSLQDQDCLIFYSMKTIAKYTDLKIHLLVLCAYKSPQDIGHLANIPFQHLKISFLLIKFSSFLVPLFLPCHSDNFKKSNNQLIHPLKTKSKIFPASLLGFLEFYINFNKPLSLKKKKIEDFSPNSQITDFSASAFLSLVGTEFASFPVKDLQSLASQTQIRLSPLHSAEGKNLHVPSLYPVYSQTTAKFLSKLRHIFCNT